MTKMRTLFAGLLALIISLSIVSAYTSYSYGDYSQDIKLSESSNIVTTQKYLSQTPEGYSKKTIKHVETSHTSLNDKINYFDKYGYSNWKSTSPRNGIYHSQDYRTSQSSSTTIKFDNRNYYNSYDLPKDRTNWRYKQGFNSDYYPYYEDYVYTEPYYYSPIKDSSGAYNWRY